MGAKPQYIQELDNRMSKLEDNIAQCHEYYKEMRDNHDSQCTVNAEVLSKVNIIMDCLKGGPLNSNNGGLVQKVKNNSEKIDNLDKRLTKREGILVTLTVIITAAVSSFIGWIFNKGGS